MVGTLFRFYAILMALVLSAGSVVGTVNAQSSASTDVLESELANEDIEFDADLYQIGDDNELVEGEGVSEEFLWLQSDAADIELILVDGRSTANGYADLTVGNMETFYDSWELLDQDDGRSNAWFIGHATSGETDIMVYFNYQRDAFNDVDLGVMLFSMPEYFIDELEQAQDTVTIGNLALFEDVNAADLEQYVDEIAGQTTTASPSADTTESGGTEDPEALGLVSETEWESPTFGVVAEWDSETWYVDTDADDALRIAGDDYSFDAVLLTSVEYEAWLDVSQTELGNEDLDSMMAYWESDKYLDGVGEDAEIVLSEIDEEGNRAAIIVVANNSSGNPYLQITEGVIMDDGTVVYIRMGSSPMHAVDSYASARNGIEVDGESVYEVFSRRDVRHVFEDLPAN